MLRAEVDPGKPGQDQASSAACTTAGSGRVDRPSTDRLRRRRKASTTSRRRWPPARPAGCRRRCRSARPSSRRSGRRSASIPGTRPCRGPAPGPASRRSWPSGGRRCRPRARRCRRSPADTRMAAADRRCSGRRRAPCRRRRAGAPTRPRNRVSMTPRRAIRRRADQRPDAEEAGQHGVGDVLPPRSRSASSGSSTTKLKHRVPTTAMRSERHPQVVDRHGVAEALPQLALGPGDGLGAERAGVHAVGARGSRARTTGR